MAGLAEGSVTPSEVFLATKQGRRLASVSVSRQPFLATVEVCPTSVKPLYVFCSAEARHAV